MLSFGRPIVSLAAHNWLLDFMVLTPLRLLLYLTVTALAGAVVWTLASPQRPAVAHNQILSIAAVTRIQSLLPHEQVQGSTLLRARLIQALWEGLVELDPRTLTPRPAVAESWEIAADNRSAVFHLRSGVSWSNGEPLIADDFVFALRQALSTPSSPAGEALLILKNAHAFRDGTITDLREVGVTAVDARTLRLDLEHPVPGLLTELCDAAWLPLHPGSYELLRSRAFLQEPTHLITNGAFRLAAVTSDKLVLSPNPFYYARSQVRLAGVELQYAEDISLYPHLLQSGAVQMSDRLTSGGMKLPLTPNVQLWRDPTLIGGYVHFNLRRSPLSDLRVRRALSLALDRESLVRTVSSTDLRPAHACLPPIAEWEDVHTVEENLAEARQLLAEAGYPGGRGFPVLNWPYRYTTFDAAVKLPEACAAQWRERLGIPVYLVLADEEEFQARQAAHDYDLMLVPWYGALPDLARLASQLAEPAMRAYSGWDGDNLAELVQAARQQTGAAERNRVLAVEQAFLKNMPATPLIFYNRHTLKRRAVAGWYPDPMGLHPLKYLYFDDSLEVAHAR